MGLYRRTLLHEKFVEIMGSEDNVFFEPAESTRMKYPCIVYSYSDIKEQYADNNKYTYNQGYTVMLIHSGGTYSSEDKREKLINLPKCKYVRHYTSDNLHHFVYSIYE